MKYEIPNDNLPTILSCLADNSNSFIRLPTILEFIKNNTFPSEFCSFVETIKQDCIRNLAEYFYNGYITKIEVKEK